MKARRGERGFALLAAVAAVLMFGALSLQILGRERILSEDVRARADRIRMEEAIRAGTFLAAQGLSIEDRTRRWTLDGRPHEITYNGVSMVIVLEDERGKIPLNLLDEDQVTRLFEAAGAGGVELQTLTDGMNDWLDEDDERRPFGAEYEEYSDGIVPSGIFRTVGEVSLLKGMNADLLERIAPYLTSNFGFLGSFSSRTASPFAIGVLTSGGEDSVEAIERERELRGQQTAITIAENEDMRGRTVTVRILARLGKGRIERASLIELTGAERQPVWIRAAPGM